MSIYAQTPRLFDAQATTFDSQGVGALKDALACRVTEERNGGFELEMAYPISGRHFEEIAQRSLIVAKPNPIDDPQPFRVYRISRPIGGICTIYARHIAYDLAGIPVEPLTANAASAALAALTDQTVIPSPFTLDTDMAATGTFTVAVPSSVRQIMGGVEGSIIDVYGGEWRYGYAGDPYHVRLMASRGADRGVQIRYGKNLIDLKQEENIAGVYTAVFPFWADAESVVMTEDRIVQAPGSYSFQRILPLDLSAEFVEAPTPAQLQAAAEAYVASAGIGTPEVSLSVSFVPLGQTTEYAGLAMLESVSLCDTIHVVFEALGVNATAKVVRTVYNVLTGRYDRVDIGSARASVADTIAGQTAEISRVTNGVPNIYRTAINLATDKITGNLGGYVVLHDSDGDGEPDEILIMDTPDIETAVNVWRFNQQGLAHSSAGYDPDAFNVAITQDGQIVADFITAGQMSAARISMEETAEGGLSNYVRIGTDTNGLPVIEIGAAGNDIVLKLYNDRISFQNSQGNEQAYFSNNAFNITSLQEMVLQGLRIAVLDNGATGFMAAAT